MDKRHFELGDIVLENGSVLRDAHLVCGITGRLNGDRSNCIVLPTYYGGTHDSYASLIGPGNVFDPAEWLIVSPNMFGNGQSSSPSTAREGSPFPTVSIGDNVDAQRRILEDHLGVSAIALVAGWSMGGMQSLHWGMRHPDLVDRIFSWCGTATCWPLNQVFLDGVKSALLADTTAQKRVGLRAFGRAYAGWAYSAQFYRDELWSDLGNETLEQFLVSWEEDHLAWDWRDLLAMLATWQTCDLTQSSPNGLRSSLAKIRAKTVIMTCNQDMYFTAYEAALEAQLIAGAELKVFDSPFGHCAGAPGRFAEPTAQITRALSEILRR